jgi:hypothetical protein
MSNPSHPSTIALNSNFYVVEGYGPAADYCHSEGIRVVQPFSTEKFVAGYRLRDVNPHLPEKGVLFGDLLSQHDHFNTLEEWHYWAEERAQAAYYNHASNPHQPLQAREEKLLLGVLQLDSDLVHGTCKRLFGRLPQGLKYSEIQLLVIGSCLFDTSWTPTRGRRSWRDLVTAQTIRHHAEQRRQAVINELLEENA